MCATPADGIGNWFAIEAEFSTGRSANGLRKRWSENNKRAAPPEPASEKVEDKNADRSRSGRIRKSTKAFDPDRLESELRYKAAKNKAKPTNAGKGDDERAMVWNTKTMRKSAGMCAPRRSHLEQYLQEHPEYEVYSGQDKKRPPPTTNVRDKTLLFRTKTRGEVWLTLVYLTDLGRRRKYVDFDIRRLSGLDVSFEFHWVVPYVPHVASVALPGRQSVSTCACVCA